MNQSNQFRLTYKWMAIAALVAVAIVFAFAPEIGVSAQQDKKQTQQKQDPQKPPKKTDEVETIKIGTQLVNILFSVQDKQNRYVTFLLEKVR